MFAATKVNGYYVFVLANVALMAIVGVGLNVLIGLTGQVSFGHVGFYAIGAYAVAILTTRAGFSFWLAWPVAHAARWRRGRTSLAQPALRVKGPYLAMITIAFGFIVEHGAVEMRALTGGQNGLMNLPRPALVGICRQRAHGGRRRDRVGGRSRWCCSAGSRSARGAPRCARSATATTAAESIGIDPMAVKTVAFAGLAALAGLAGGLFAPLSGFVTPSSFAFLQSILFVLVVMIGGAGSFAGPVVGAVIVGVLPEALASLEEYRLLFFGALLLVVLWVAPGRHRRAGAANARPLARARSARGRDRSNVRGAATARAAGARPRRPRARSRSPDSRCTFGGLRAVSDLAFDGAARGDDADSSAPTAQARRRRSTC